MVKALGYILIIAKHGCSQQVANKLMPYKQVQDIHEIFGQYDLIVKVLEEDTNALGNFVKQVINNIPEVESSETLVVSDIPKEEAD